MNRPWFDPSSGFLLFDQYVMERPSFHSITDDSVITAEEIAEQTERVVVLLKDLESRLEPETKEAATEALCELAVLNVLHLKRLGALL